MDRLDKAILLEKGAAIIDERGWGQDMYENPATGQVCMLGAVRIAHFGDVTFSQAINAGTASREAVMDHYHWETHELDQVLGHALGDDHGPYPVGAWNDMECPGGHEAAETLRKMAGWYRRQA